MGAGIQEHLNLLRTRGFDARVCMVDPQSGFVPLQNRFPGLQIVTGGAGDHLPKVDSKMRRIKEVCRCVKSELEWTLPKGLVRDLVKYGTSRTNIRRTKAAKTNVCPRIKFTG